MSTLITAVQGLADTLEAKAFSTGSKGFYAGGKVADGSGLYQAQVSAILVGSKHDPSATVQGTNEEARAAVQTVVSGLQPKVFGSGKVGVYTNGKVAIGGQVFQVAAQAVLVR